jgi:N-acetylglutamate synthase-like GNAT family acetyltransferase
VPLKRYQHTMKTTPRIRHSTPADLVQIFEVINDSAVAYRDVIPPDQWHEPYMPLERLQREMGEGIEFWVYEDDGEIVGVMGIQSRSDVDLIRHAYVRTTRRKQGIGEALLKYLEDTAVKPILIGTWAAASWAISFYRKNGYRVLEPQEAEKLLRAYWSIPERQIETSVVLANTRWN